MKKNIIINLINANQGAHLIRSNNFLLNLKKIDSNNNYVILTEKKLNIFNNNFIYLIFNISKNKIIAIIQRFIIQSFFINYYYFKYNISVYINFSHTIPLISFKKILKIIAVTNVAPFIDFKKFSNFQKLKMLYLKYKILYSCIFSDKIISISNFCKILLVKNNINKKKITVIYNGINKPLKSVSNNKTKKYFLYVSHFYRYKNFENLIIAYSNLPPEISNKFKLILIGHPYDFKYFLDVKKQIRKLKLVNKIEIHSNFNRKTIDEYIKNCYLFIFPSLIENCPMSLLEAIQYNRPILSSKIPPMNEFCQNFPLYFNPYYPASITNSIIEFCNNSAIIKKSFNYTLIKKNLSWGNFTKKILSMYKI